MAGSCGSAAPAARPRPPGPSARSSPPAAAASGRPRASRSRRSPSQSWRTPRISRAASISCRRISVMFSSTSGRSIFGFRIEPRSPPVQVTTWTSTPSLTYFTVEAAPLLDSSSGWACTCIRRSMPTILGMGAECENPSGERPDVRALRRRQPGTPPDGHRRLRRGGRRRPRRGWCGRCGSRATPTSSPRCAPSTWSTPTRSTPPWSRAHRRRGRRRQLPGPRDRCRPLRRRRAQLQGLRRAAAPCTAT